MKKKIEQKGRAYLMRLEREKMLDEVVSMMLRFKKRSEITNFLHEKYKFQLKSIPNILAEAQKIAAATFTPEEKEIAKRASIEMCTELMWDNDDLSQGRIAASKHLHEVMGNLKQQEISVQQNTLNNVSLKELSTEELTTILAALKKE